MQCEFDIVEPIDRGSFGSVDKVRLPDGTIAARKLFDPVIEVLETEDYDSLRDRFAREIRVQSSLPPDQIMPIIEASLECDRPWLIMPLAEADYSQQIKRDRSRGKITPGPLIEILNALVHLHSSGYVHRDLKPQNVLLHDGRWKLTDMGLVLRQRPDFERISASEHCWGSLTYCAPEQFMYFDEVTFAADIYSYGCILHELVDGSPRKPFSRHTTSGPLAPLIERCTAGDPAERYPSIGALRRAVAEVLSDKHHLRIMDK